MKFQNIDSKIKSYNIDNSNNLMKVELLVVCNGDNPNKTKFSLNAIDKAIPTIKNIPILAYILEDEGDFDEHNMDYEIITTEDGCEIKKRYQEVPIGVIPENCQPEYIDMNGRKYLKVQGYIWKCYSNGGAEIISNSEYKNVSMEIKVNEGMYDENDGLYDITDFNFLGITCLGSHIRPGIPDARIYQYSSQCKTMLEDIYKEIYSLEERGKEELNMDEQVVVVEEVVEEVNEETHETSDTVESECVTEESLTIEADTIKVGEVQEQEYKLDLSCFAKLLKVVPETMEEVVDALIDKFNAKETEINNLQSELEGLKAFKQSVLDTEYKAEIEQIANEFTLDTEDSMIQLSEEEISEFKEKAINKQITKEEFKGELYKLQGMKFMANKEALLNNKHEKFSAKDTGIDLKINKETKSTVKPYGGILG